MRAECQYAVLHIQKQKYEEMSINMASDPEKLEHFTITSTVWHLYADRDCKQQL